MTDNAILKTKIYCHRHLKINNSTMKARCYLPWEFTENKLVVDFCYLPWIFTEASMECICQEILQKINIIICCYLAQYYQIMQAIIAN